MTRFKLTDRDRRILGAFELDAEQPLASVAREIGAKPSSIHRSLQRLKACGAIAGRTAVIDSSQLGLIEYGVNLELAPRSIKERNQFIQHVAQLPRLSWLAEVGGIADLMCNVLASHPGELHAFFDQMLKSHPHIVVGRSIVQRTTRIRYYRGYLLSKRRGLRYRLGDGTRATPLSETEKQVVRALDSMKFESLAELAKQSSIPASTFSRCVRALKERKVLLGFGYRLNTDLLGVRQFRILFRFKFLPPARRTELERCIGEIPGAKLLVRCLGAWDYESEFDAADSLDARGFASKVWERFPNELEGVELIPILRHVKYISFGAGV